MTQAERIAAAQQRLRNAMTESHEAAQAHAAAVAAAQQNLADAQAELPDADS